MLERKVKSPQHKIFQCFTRLQSNFMDQSQTNCFQKNEKRFYINPCTYTALYTYDSNCNLKRHLVSQLQNYVLWIRNLAINCHFFWCLSSRWAVKIFKTCMLFPQRLLYLKESIDFCQEIYRKTINHWQPCRKTTSQINLGSHFAFLEVVLFFFSSFLLVIEGQQQLESVIVNFHICIKEIMLKKINKKQTRIRNIFFFFLGKLRALNASNFLHLNVFFLYFFMYICCSSYATCYIQLYLFENLNCLCSLSEINDTSTLHDFCLRLIYWHSTIFKLYKLMQDWSKK